MGGSNVPHFELKPGAIPNDAWTELCSDTCAVCGGQCDNQEFDDLEHDEDCPGCPICEIPIRLFLELVDGRVLGVALHPTCFDSILIARSL